MTTSIHCLKVVLLFQSDQDMYLQLNPSKAQLADVLVGTLKANRWHHLCLITENSYDEDGFLATLLQLTSHHSRWNIEAHVRVSARHHADLIGQQLRDFAVLQSRVIVMHCGVALASRVFQMARQLGLLQRGYAWFVTEDAIATSQRSLRHYPVGVVALKFERTNYHDIVANSLSLVSKASDASMDANNLTASNPSATSGTFDCFAEPSKHTHADGRTLFR